MVYEELVKTKGVSLPAFGVRGSALKREGALLPLDVLRGTSIAVLGGNKKETSSTSSRPIGTATRSAVSRRQTMLRALGVAEDRVRRFPERQRVTLQFALVVCATRSP